MAWGFGPCTSLDALELASADVPRTGLAGGTKGVTGGAGFIAGSEGFGADLGTGWIAGGGVFTGSYAFDAASVGWMGAG